MTTIPRDFIELLLAKIDLVDLINLQIPLRKKSGSNYFARCPFHNEKSASFSVSQPKQFFYCFGCGAHGNAIDFLMQHDHLSFPEAVENLAHHAGMEIPRDAKFTGKKAENTTPLFELMTQVAAHYYDHMRQSQRAITYLKNRGITGKIAQQFQLGYAQNSWHDVLNTFGKTELDQKKLLDTGLIIKKSEGGFYDRFRDRIMFPIHDYRGRMIGFGGRIIDDGEPKYLNSPETILFQKGHELYGLHQALKTNRKLDRVIIVEGYMDVIALFQHGITYAVATLGTATSSHHIQRLARYSAEIIFCFDGDKAGKNAAWRALEVLLPLMQDGLQVRFLFLPDGEDPDSLVRKEGKIEFEKRMQTAHPLSTFFFQTLAQQSDMETMEGRARFANAALNYIKTLPAGIFAGILLDELSKRARIDLKQLKEQIKYPDKKIEAPAVTKPAEIPVKFSKAIEKALALLVQHPHLAGSINDTLPQMNLPGFSFLTKLIAMLQKNPHVTTGILLEYWRGQKEETLLAKLTQWDNVITDNEGLKSEFLGAMRQLTLQGYEEEINRLLAKAALSPLSEDEKQALAAWIQKKKTLSQAS